MNAIEMSVAELVCEVPMEITSSGIVLPDENEMKIISGTAVVNGTLLTLPIPDDYSFYCYLSSERVFVDGDLRRFFKDKLGVVQQKRITLAVQNTTGDFPWWIVVDRAGISINGTNKNTMGLLHDGDEWTFIAWKPKEG